MSRTTLALVATGLLAAFFVLTLAFPIGGTVGVVLFAVVVVLVGVLFFRFHPAGDVWDWSREIGINPWLAVVLILLLGALGFAFRWGLLHSAGT